MVVIDDGLLSFDEVEARLIEAMRVFRWGMRQGAAFATDGPWSQMKLDWSERWAHSGEDVDGKGGNADRIAAQALRSPRPDRTMISRAEEAGGWLVLCATDADRIVVVRALAQLAEGRSRIDWGKVVVGDPTAPGLRDRDRMRYSRSLTRITRGVNAARAAGVPVLPGVAAHV